MEKTENIEEELKSYEEMWDELKDWSIERINNILHGFGAQSQLYSYCELWRKMNDITNQHMIILGKLVERKMKKITCPTCGEINLEFKSDKNG